MGLEEPEAVEVEPSMVDLSMGPALALAA
jgi:hypothetical protein